MRARLGTNVTAIISAARNSGSLVKIASLVGFSKGAAINERPLRGDWIGSARVQKWPIGDRRRKWSKSMLQPLMNPAASLATTP